MSTNHALLSPSASHRWLHCPASARLEANIPGQETDYAAEGTLAHAYCAQTLKSILDLDTSKEDAEIEELRITYGSAEMAEYVLSYVSYILDKFHEAQKATPDAQLLVETRLDFNQWVPEAFGTADALIIADDCLEVFDFKYGKGKRVEALNNSQMRIYALGALAEFSDEYRIDRVKMTIIQPRLENICSDELTVAELSEWAEKTLKPGARKAYNYDAKPRPGEWCQFCRAKHVCKCLASESINASAIDYRLLSAEEIASRVLPMIPAIKSWLANLEEHLIEQAKSGVKYPGFKLVEGRSIRKIQDRDAVIKHLVSLGYNSYEILKPTELLPITQLEKLIGKKRFSEECGQWIAKTKGAPVLTPDTDSRSAYNAISDDFGDLEL